MECMRAQTRPRFILSSERGLGNGVRTHVNSKGKISSTERYQGGSNPQCCIMQDSELHTLPTELFRTRCCLIYMHRETMPWFITHLKE